MNENIDLTKILKDCPKGTKLYSPILGDCKFEEVCINCVKVRVGHFIFSINQNATYPLGTINSEEPMLFPSREQRDWSKFIAPWYKNVSSQTNERTWLYLVSDVLTWKDGIGQYLDNPEVQEIAKRLCNKYAQKLYNPSVLSNSSNIGNDEQKSADKAEPKFKVGDRVKHKETNKDDVYEIIKVYDDSYGIAGFNWRIYMKYQDQYELVPNKFDPKTLNPFDKVLARMISDSVWVCDFFSHIHPNEKYCVSVGSWSYNEMIPYNDDTKHLVGTTEEAPEYYRYWEE